MKPKNFKLLNLIWIVFVFLILSARDAHAYLDPGTGSYILQLLVAGALGSLFVIKTFWRSIVNFIRNLFPRDKKDNNLLKKSKDNGKK
jgi:hypothetical protein